MKIIICTRDLDYGVGSHVKLLSREIEKMDEIEKTLIVGPKKLTTFSSKIRFKILKPRGRYSVTKQPFFAVECRRMIEHILKVESYDIIHLRFPIIARNFGIPLITTFGALSYFAAKGCPATDCKARIADLFHRAYEVFDRSTMKHSTKIIFTSKNALDKATSRYGNEKQKFVYIPLVVDSSKFYPMPVCAKAALRRKYGLAQNKRYILFAGRVDVFKGVPDLVHAVKALRSEYKDVELIVAGDGPLREKISRLNYVKCLGRIPYQYMNEVYNISDMFVLSSLYEGGGCYVLLEAMSCGLPVVATNTGDTREQVNDDRMITNISDLTDMTKKMRFVMDLPEKELSKIKEANRKHIMEHYGRRNVLTLLEVYEDAMERYEMRASTSSAC